jgi:hypothetical protein
MSTRASRLPAPPLLCQPSSLRLPRQWGWGGRPCSFPELPSGQWDRAAVESGSAAAAANPTATLVNATVLHDATASSYRVSGCGLNTHHHGIDLRTSGASGAAVGPCHWSVEEQSTALSAASERGFRHAKQARKEEPMGIGIVRDPSSWLAGAMAGRSPMSGEWKRRPLAPPSALLASGWCPRPYVEERGSRTPRWQGNVQFTRFSICDGDRSARR